MKNSSKTILIGLTRGAVFFSIFIYICQVMNFFLMPYLVTIRDTNLYEMRHLTYNVDAVFVGTSRTYRSVDSPYLTAAFGKNYYNIANPRQSFAEDLKYLRELSELKNQTSFPETVFIEVSSIKLYRNYSFSHWLEDGIIRLGGWVAFTRNLFTHKVIDNIKLRLQKDPKVSVNYIRQNIEGGMTTYMGRAYWPCNWEIEQGNMGANMLGQVHYALDNFWDESFVQRRLADALKETIEYCQENGAKVVLFTPPWPPLNIVQNYEQYDEYLGYIYENFCTPYGVEFYDFSLLRKDVLFMEDNYFYDADHVNGTGGACFSHLLEELIVNVISDAGTRGREEYLYTSAAEMYEDCDRVLAAQISYIKEEKRFETNVVVGNLVRDSYNIRYLYKFDGRNDSEYCEFDGSSLSLPNGKLVIRAEAFTDNGMPFQFSVTEFKK